MANIVTLVIAFALSNFFHIISLAVIRGENLSLQELTLNMSSFFMLQPVGALAEMLVMHYYLKFTSSTSRNMPRNSSYEKSQAQESMDSRGKLPPTVARIVGYIWVL